MAVVSSARPEALPRRISLWWDQLPESEMRTRPALAGDVDADVAIVGGGYTGLWTAFYLTEFAPDTRVVVLDAERMGFGASGRNGGWCTTEMPSLLMTLVRRHGPMAAMRLYRAGKRSLDEIERVTRAEEIDCGWRRDGSLYVARTAPQVARLQSWQEARHKLGITDLSIVEGPEATARVGMSHVLAAGFTPNCAAVQPAALVRGLAATVERRRVSLFEGTRARALRPGQVLTDHGTVRARAVICATEAYTGSLRGHTRRVLPLYSRVIATEPLPPDLWAALGWHERVTVADSRYQFGYLQRTADDRLVLGGRGAGYLFGSRTGARFDTDRTTHERLRHTLTELFPALSGVRVTHEWGGAYGLHRDTEPGVVYDPATGLGHAGGYGGEGIALSNLAGRTLAALILGEQRPETKLCWTNHRSRRWEPEPLRFLGVRTVTTLATRADRYEDRTDKQARLAGVAVRAVV